MTTTVLPRKYFEDVVVGEEVPGFDITVSLTSLVIYAAATWDFHRYHYDAGFVSALKIPRPFMDGQMLGALMARQLMRWGGIDSFVRRLNYRQRAMVYAGDVIAVRGRVIQTEIENNRPLALCALSVTGPEGLIVSRDATAAVELTRRPLS